MTFNDITVSVSNVPIPHVQTEATLHCAAPSSAAATNYLEQQRRYSESVGVR